MRFLRFLILVLTLAVGAFAEKIAHSVSNQATLKNFGQFFSGSLSSLTKKDWEYAMASASLSSQVYRDLSAQDWIAVPFGDKCHNLQKVAFKNFDDTGLQFAIYSWPAENVIAVAFRGSAQSNDWAQNTNFIPVDADFDSKGDQGLIGLTSATSKPPLDKDNDADTYSLLERKAAIKLATKKRSKSIAKAQQIWKSRKGTLGDTHGGFFQAYMSGQGFLWRKLHEMASKVEKRPMLLLTGHSLGAAMAQLAAIDIRTNPVMARLFSRIHVPNFGSPMIGLPDFIANYNEFVNQSPSVESMVTMAEDGASITIQRFANVRGDLMDMIPTLPPGYAHAGTGFRLPCADPLCGQKPFLDLWNLWLHSRSNYVFSTSAAGEKKAGKTGICNDPCQFNVKGRKVDEVNSSLLPSGLFCGLTGSANLDGKLSVKSSGTARLCWTPVDNTFGASMKADNKRCSQWVSGSNNAVAITNIPKGRVRLFVDIKKPEKGFFDKLVGFFSGSSNSVEVDYQVSFNLARPGGFIY